MKKQYISNPKIWKDFWETYVKNVTISTSPTELGLWNIEVQHVLYKVKCLQKVPIDLFLDKGIWIEIQQAKSKGFITVNFEETDFEKLMKEKYLQIVDPDNSISSSDEWKVLNNFFVDKIVKEMIIECKK